MGTLLEHRKGIEQQPGQPHKRATLCAVAIAIAWAATLILPLDLLREAGTSPVRHVVLPAVGLAGVFLATRSGLSPRAPDALRGLWLPALTGLLVAAYVYFLDRGAAGISASLLTRLLYYCFRSLNEEILYRLGAMTLLAWLLLQTRLHRRADGRLVAYVLAAAGAQMLNLWINVPAPADLGELTFLLVRFFAPGFLWGMIYWKHGFVPAATSHMATHLWLQPLLS